MADSLANAIPPGLMRLVGTVQRTHGTGRRQIKHLVEVALRVPIRHGDRQVQVRLANSQGSYRAEKSVTFRPWDARALAKLLREAASRCHTTDVNPPAPQTVADKSPG